MARMLAHATPAASERPKNDRKSEIVSSLENIQSQISALQLEHRTLQAQMLRIDVMQRKLIVEQTNLVNKLLDITTEPEITPTTIQSLPTEVLHLIFREFISSDAGATSVYILTAVCHAWRSICHGYAELWTLLHLSESTTPEEVRARLELSKEKELTFQISVEPSGTPFSRAVLDLLKPTTGRWISLKLEANHTDFKDLFLDRLLYLEPDQLQHISLASAPKELPRLTESHILVLKKYIRRFPALSNRLRSLHLDGVYSVLGLDALILLFKAVPNITHYSFTAPEKYLTSILIPIMHYYDRPNDPDAIILPRLTSLEMWLPNMTHEESPQVKKLIEDRRNIPIARRKELAQLQTVTLHVPASQAEKTRELLKSMIESGMDIFIYEL